MKKNLLLTVLFTVFLNLQMLSQTEIISVWKNSIPGEIKNSNYQEKEVFKNEDLQSTSQVTNPTLSIYMPQKPNRTAVLVIPGGGYSHLSMHKEGKKIAEWLNSMDIAAFVLKYRLPNDLIMEEKNIGPLQDAQESIKIIRRNATKWNIDPTKIGVIGFSAGGHLAATLSTQYDLKTYSNTDSLSSRPDFSILIYPVISMKENITHKGSQINLLGENPSEQLINKFSNELVTTNKTPPTYIVHATDDHSVVVENSINYYLALKNNGVSVEMHLYEKGGHGFGLGKETEFWSLDCIKWLKNHFML